MKKKELDKIVLSSTLASLHEILNEDSELEKQTRTARLVSEEDEEEAEKEKKPASKKPEKVKPKNSAQDLVDVSLDDVIDKLNMMRSGKSADNKEIRDSLDEYFKGLSMGERQSLFVFLDALNQILTAGVDGEKAPEPDEKGIDTTPTRSDKKTPDQKKNDSIIVVGEAQRTEDIKRLIREMQR